MRVIRGCIWPHTFHAAAASCCSASRLGKASAHCPLHTAHCPLAVWPSDSRIPAKGPVSNGTGATHSPAAASVPVAVPVPSPAQLGAFKPETTSPSEAISDCALSPNDIERQRGSSHALPVARDDDNPQPPSDTTRRANPTRCRITFWAT
ncbi:uncharacterized protein K444DRAFT_48115 [Hyaloscypha bicolor E]|uniref:Uncharacterized protein n=1 Tax=Hyaloscypha bicolor E TaxID=1095630 RepID=A0A2J6T2I0_9HELO|nr:uncharacterized protein K444DRAFT_48115 [Hyaloscypha bicolor E]PMD57143.1 hypothetical protein K444DRAFT_48115 [Hyaloscypha bicolor E]